MCVRALAENPLPGGLLVEERIANNVLALGILLVFTVSITFRVFFLNCFCFGLNFCFIFFSLCYYPHILKDSVSPACVTFVIPLKNMREQGIS